MQFLLHYVCINAPLNREQRDLNLLKPRKKNFKFNMFSSLMHMCGKCINFAIFLRINEFCSGVLPNDDVCLMPVSKSLILVHVTFYCTRFSERNHIYNQIQTRVLYAWVLRVPLLYQVLHSFLRNSFNEGESVWGERKRSQCNSPDKQKDDDEAKSKQFWEEKLDL